MADRTPTEARDGREVLLESKHLRFVRSGTWEYVERRNVCGIVAIVPVTGNGEFVLVEQYRIPVDARVIEVPAGLADVVDGRNEPLEEAARRELREETGYHAPRLQYLFTGPPSAGLSSEVVTFFLATNVQRVGAGGGDANENIQVHTVPLATVDDWLDQQARSGKLIDPKVYTGLYAIRRGAWTDEHSNGRREVVTP
jgi:ADP-ribose pyrophosphatase